MVEGSARLVRPFNWDAGHRRPRALLPLFQRRADLALVEGSGSLKGTTCQSYGDHRVAMALAIAGLLAEGETVIEGAERVSVSYPEFWEHLETMTKRDVLAE